MPSAFLDVDELCNYQEENRLLLEVRRASGAEADWELRTTDGPRRTLISYAYTGTNLGPSVVITRTVRNSFHRRLANGDQRAIRLTNRPLERAVVAVDIVKFSEMEPVEQLLAANALAWVLERCIGTVSPAPEGRICTGDGYTLVFTNVHHACHFASLVAATLERLNDVVTQVPRLPEQLRYRIGVDYGAVHRFRDWTDNTAWNYIGSAVNNAHRVLAVIGAELDDVIFVSDEVRRLLPYRQRANLSPQGRRADKHGKEHRVFLLAHNAWLSEDDLVRLHAVIKREADVDIDDMIDRGEQ